MYNIVSMIMTIYYILCAYRDIDTALFASTTAKLVQAEATYRAMNPA